MKARLLCTDLDRTLLPNGAAPESTNARERLGRCVARPNVRLAYVTGRHLESVEDSMEEYALPLPDFVVCDVGTSIFRRDRGWDLLSGWADCQSELWNEPTVSSLEAALDGFGDLRIQEEERQSRFKLSYYGPALDDESALLHELRISLERAGIDAKIVYSIDETRELGLLDFLPPRSGKLGAIEYLMQMESIARSSVLFAGDSGNDLEVLTSSIPSVLVANASENVRREALDRARLLGNERQLYIASGGVLGMNGNYAAGILEGVLHFWPEAREWTI